MEAEGTTTWSYDSCKTGKLCTVNAPGGYTETHSYDSLLRPSATTLTVDARTFTTTLEYDNFGRVTREHRPNDYVALAEQLITLAEAAYRYAENAHYWTYADDGIATLAAEAQSGQGTDGYTTFWRATARDAAGRLRTQVHGNGLVTVQQYDPASGHLWGIQTGDGFGRYIRDLSYQYDDANNVTWRADLVMDRDESFYYDSADRLSGVDIQGHVGTTPYSHGLRYRYDGLGNILCKSDRVSGVDCTAGGITHGYAADSHRLSWVSGKGSYAYDANGNTTSGGGRTLGWSSDNKPIHILANGHSVDFAYGPERARYKKTESGPAGSDTLTYYVGRHYEEVETRVSAYETHLEHRHHILADGKIVALHVQYGRSGSPDPTGPDDTRYLHQDALGSVDTITDQHGNVIERLSYDPFGKRMGDDWRLSDPTALDYAFLSHTNRGFTGHEHLDDVGLIHMNGRVYDPEIGRFLSADPVVPSANNAQAYNRYAYALNNPLKYTDPSGHNPLVLIPVLVAAAGAELAVVAIVTFIVTLGITGGDLGAALKGVAFTLLAAGLSDLVAGIDWVKHFGEAVQPLTKVLSTVAHGVAQGTLSEAFGGDFKSGFWGAAIGHGIGYAMKGTNALTRAVGKLGSANGKIIRTMIASVAGGAAARLGGGKFANGAVSAAFVHLFNSEAHAGQQNNYRITEAERQMVADGNIRGFWESRLAVGDPVARAGLGSLDAPGGPIDYLFGGVSINNRLVAYDRVYGSGNIDLNAVRLDLANAHIGAVDQDTRGVLGLLHPEQIAEYHHTTFEGYGLPSTAFGGTPFTGAVGEANWTRPVWCLGCDWR